MGSYSMQRPLDALWNLDELLYILHGVSTGAVVQRAILAVKLLHSCGSNVPQAATSLDAASCCCTPGHSRQGHHGRCASSKSTSHKCAATKSIQTCGV